MPELRLANGFARLDALEARLCVPFNGIARVPAVRRYFAAVSRLGDGVAWYAMLCVLPLVFGKSAIWPTLHIGITALVVVVVHKVLKANLVRERPFASHDEVVLMAPPLDRYSFPSGHTMHAMAFTVMLLPYFPGVMLIMLPFAVSVAVSRIALGLHYPSDVAAGALIGWALARLSLLIPPLLGL
jgi:undecaprenyl-diphosphatase